MLDTQAACPPRVRGAPPWAALVILVGAITITVAAIPITLPLHSTTTKFRPDHRPAPIGPRPMPSARREPGPSPANTPLAAPVSRRATRTTGDSHEPHP